MVDHEVVRWTDRLDYWRGGERSVVRRIEELTLTQDGC
jgi:hypothetical protein